MNYSPIWGATPQQKAPSAATEEAPTKQLLKSPKNYPNDSTKGFGATKTAEASVAAPSTTLQGGGWFKTAEALKPHHEYSVRLKIAKANLEGMVQDAKNPIIDTKYSREAVLNSIVEWGTPRKIMFRNKAITQGEKNSIKRLKPTHGTVRELIAQLEAGIHVLPAPIDDLNGESVSEANVNSGGRLVVLDYDGTDLSLVTYIKLVDLSERFGFMFAPTYSASSKRLKVRIVWLTQGEMSKEGMSALRAVMNAIFLLLTDEATDPAMKNVSQVIYGNNRKDTIDNGAGVQVSASKFYIPEVLFELPCNFADKLAYSAAAMALNLAAPSLRNAVGKRVLDKLGVSLMMDEVVRYLRARGWTKGRVPGSGQYDVMFRIIAAMTTVTDCTEEVVNALASCGWTHLNEGETWEQTWAALSKRNNAATNKVSIGSLVHILREHLPDLRQFTKTGAVLTRNKSNFTPTFYDAHTADSATPETHARQLLKAIAAAKLRIALIDTITGGGKTAAMSRITLELLKESGLRLPDSSKIIALVDKLEDMKPYTDNGFTPIIGRHTQYFTTADGVRVQFDGSKEHIKATEEAIDAGRDVSPANSAKADLVSVGYTKGLDPSDIHGMGAILHGSNPEPLYRTQMGLLKSAPCIVMTKALFEVLHLASKLPEQAVILIDESGQISRSKQRKYSYSSILESAKIHPNASQVAAIVESLKTIAAAQKYAPVGQKLREKIGEEIDAVALAELNGYYSTEAAALVSKENNNIAQQAAAVGLTDITDRLYGNEPAIAIAALHNFLGGGVGETIEISRDGITVWTAQTVWQDALATAALVVFADATQTPETLSAIVGKKPEDISYLKSTQVDAGNSRLTALVASGFTGDELTTQALRMIDHTATEYGIDAVLTKKSRLAAVRQICGEDALCGSFGKDSRGSNKFYLAGCRKLLIVGLPTPNVGSVTARLTVELGREPSAQEVGAEMNRIASNELVQAIGRLRANLMPGEKFEVVVLSNQEIEWADSTSHVTLEEAAIDRAAEAAQAYILRASHHMIQARIAEVLGVSQSTVSRRLRDWDGMGGGAAATIALEREETLKRYLETIGEHAAMELKPNPEVIQLAKTYQETLDPDEVFKFPNIVEMTLSVYDRLKFVPESEWPEPSITNLPKRAALAFEAAWSFIKDQWEMGDETIQLCAEVLQARIDGLAGLEPTG